MHTAEKHCGAAAVGDDADDFGAQVHLLIERTLGAVKPGLGPGSVRQRGEDQSLGAGGIQTLGCLRDPFV